MRLIDADTLDKVKFHPLPYPHITPSDADAESYERGWNDAIDAIMSEVPSIEERKTGRWVVYKAPDKYHCGLVKCPFCGEDMIAEADEYNYCPNCGARMEG